MLRSMGIFLVWMGRRFDDAVHTENHSSRSFRAFNIDARVACNTCGSLMKYSKTPSRPVRKCNERECSAP